MKATVRRTVSQTGKFESPEAIRKRLAAFAQVTRTSAQRRNTVEEPAVRGSILAGRRVRASS